MKPCRYCQKPFEPEGFEVFCSPECASNGNSRGRDNNVNIASSHRPTPASQAPITLTEEEFQNNVISLAKELGWKPPYHTRNSKKSAAGFPDLVLWRDRIIFAELKTEDGPSSAAQTTVVEQLREAKGEVYVWRPSDWAEVVKVLT